MEGYVLDPPCLCRKLNRWTPLPQVSTKKTNYPIIPTCLKKITHILEVGAYVFKKYSLIDGRSSFVPAIVQFKLPTVKIMITSSVSTNFVANFYPEFLQFFMLHIWLK